MKYQDRAEETRWILDVHKRKKNRR